MKKSEWIYLSKIMWEFSDTHDGKLSILLKELIRKINKNMEVIIDDMGEHDKTIGSD